MSDRDRNDPLFVPSLDEFLDAPYVPRSKPGRRAPTPHAALKHKCRAALTKFRQQHDAHVVLLPSIVGKIKTMAGREISVGKRGQADDTLLIWGCAIGIEYKAGADRQSEVQRAFQQRWEAAGGHYIICRKPEDLTDFLTLIGAERGRVF